MAVTEHSYFMKLASLLNIISTNWNNETCFNMYFKSPVIIFLVISYLPELDLQLDSFFSRSVSDDAVPALSVQILSQGCPAI